MALSTKNACVKAIVAAFLLLCATEAYARAGGGGGGGGGNVSLWDILLFIPCAIYFAYVNFRINVRKKIISAALMEMAKIEPEWTEDNLVQIAKEKFILLQDAWGKQDLEVLRQNLHPSLYPDWEHQIKEQIYRNEANPMINLCVKKIRIVDVRNYADDEKDEFTVAIDAKADDQTVDLRSSKVKKSDDSSFREFWTFEKENSDWALKAVAQSDGWRKFMNGMLVFEKMSRP